MVPQRFLHTSYGWPTKRPPLLNYQPIYGHLVCLPPPPFFFMQSPRLSSLVCLSLAFFILLTSHYHSSAPFSCCPPLRLTRRHCHQVTTGGPRLCAHVPCRTQFTLSRQPQCIVCGMFPFSFFFLVGFSLCFLWHTVTYIFLNTMMNK